MGGRVTTASGRPIGVAGFEALRSADEGQPLAVPREQVAGRLGHKVAPGKLEAALAAVEPYRRADGTPLWSLHLVRVELELVRRTRRAPRGHRPREGAAMARPGRGHRPPGGYRPACGGHPTPAAPDLGERGSGCRDGRGGRPRA